MEVLATVLPLLNLKDVSVMVCGWECDHCIAQQDARCEALTCAW
jgi:hypothetical protein